MGSSRGFDAKTHCESRDADSQSFRTVRICQNGRKLTILFHQKGNWIDALCRSTDKPRLECCAGQNGTINYVRAVEDHSQGVAINPDPFSFKQKPLHWKEHRLHTGNPSSYKSILENEWSMGRKIESKNHKTSLFLDSPERARIVIETANDRLERTR